MNSRRLASGMVMLALSWARTHGAQPDSATSEWVHYDAQHRLVYRATPRGDRIMDFSQAGYMGGGVPIPTPPVRAKLAPSGDDDTAAIQTALDAVASQPATNQLRGAVVLGPGTFKCGTTLNLRADGVVLRGSGSGSNGTTIEMTGSRHLCFSIGASARAQEQGKAQPILDNYVPSGSSSVRVANAKGFKRGDLVLISRPVTAAWVRFMGMDGLVRDGKKETWLGVGGTTTFERTVRKVEGDRLTLDIPLSDSIDRKWVDPPGATVAHITEPRRVTQAGVESLRIVAPPRAVQLSEGHHQAIRVNGAVDCWVRDIAIEDTINSVGVGSSAKRITVEHVGVTHRTATIGAAKPADFSTDGSQVLFHRCSSTGSNLFYFVTGGRATGPNVLLNCTFRGNGHIQPHMRWSTGLLVDNCQVPEGGIDFMNRGEMGSGHGWTIGWAVAWNCVAKSFIIQQPPGTANWAIGCRGTRETSGMPFGHQPKLPEGFFDSHDSPVTPASLYLAQLQERLGPQALSAISH